MSFLSKSSPILFAIASYFLYGSQAVVLEQKLSGYSTGAVIAVLYILMLPLALIRLAVMKATGEPIVWPSGSEGWKWMFVAAVVFFLADYAMTAAYTKAFGLGAEYMAAIVGVGLLFPVFANVVKYLAAGAVNLNRYHYASYTVAAVSVVLILMAMKTETAEAASQPAAALADVPDTEPSAGIASK
jgi:hypothetical protein